MLLGATDMAATIFYIYHLLHKVAYNFLLSLGSSELGFYKLTFLARCKGKGCPLVTFQYNAAVLKPGAELRGGGGDFLSKMGFALFPLQN